MSRRQLVSMAVTAALASALTGSPCVLAQELTIPTPNVVIYPGDIIRNDMLTNIPVDQAQGAVGAIIDKRSELVGKQAKRTLLPGRAIATIAVANPRAVTNGAAVRLFYRSGGLTIVTEGSALQDGSVGDMIRVRNIDSGLTVSGSVQSDGSVRVSGG